jgi:DNA-directed RNA polymerase subunit RPC12/RpoP
MTQISGPYIKFKCAKCSREIERQINARRALQEIDELRDERGMTCAECWAGLETRVA